MQKHLPDNHSSRVFVVKFFILILFLFVGTHLMAQQDQTNSQIEKVLNENQNSLMFIQNKGQWRSEDIYRASTPFSTVQVLKKGILLSVLDQNNVADACALDDEIEEAEAHGLPVPKEKVIINQHAWMIEFVGMNPETQIQTKDKICFMC